MPVDDNTTEALTMQPFGPGLKITKMMKLSYVCKLYKGAGEITLKQEKLYEKLYKEMEFNSQVTTWIK